MRSKKTIGEMSFETNLLVEILSQLRDNEIAGYDLLSDAVGRNIRSDTQTWGWLRSAMRYCQREYAIKLDVVRNVGVKRLDSEGVISTTRHTVITRISNAAKRGLKTLDVLNDEYLNNTQRVEANQLRASLGAISAMTVKKRQVAPPERKTQPEISAVASQTIERLRGQVPA